jgi:hypothetical protein
MNIKNILIAASLLASGAFAAEQPLDAEQLCAQANEALQKHIRGEVGMTRCLKSFANQSRIGTPVSCGICLNNGV